LDGIHRCFTFKAKGIKKIAAVEWKDKPLDYEKNKVALLLESAACNTSHGDRLSPGDKKRISRDIASTDPECTWTEEALAEKLGVIRQTVNTWISDIRARQRADRDIIIIRLSRLGWTQDEIGKVVGMSWGRITQIVNNANFGEINNLLSQGRDMEYIARHYNMAFLNADWRDFESTPASKEKPDKSITIFDYHRLLSKTGWKTTHRIECPLSSERLSGNQVQRMQDKRILGTVGRTLLIAKRA